MTLRRGANTSYRLNIKQQILNNSCYYYVICKQTPRRRVASVLSSSTYAVAGGTTPPTRRPCKCPFAVVRDDPLTHIRLVRRARPSRPPASSRAREHRGIIVAVVTTEARGPTRYHSHVTISSLQRVVTCTRTTGRHHAVSAPSSSHGESRRLFFFFFSFSFFLVFSFSVRHKHNIFPLKTS